MITWNKKIEWQTSRNCYSISVKEFGHIYTIGLTVFRRSPWYNKPSVIKELCKLRRYHSNRKSEYYACNVEGPMEAAVAEAESIISELDKWPCL